MFRSRCCLRYTLLVSCRAHYSKLDGSKLVLAAGTLASDSAAPFATAAHVAGGDPAAAVPSEGLASMAAVRLPQLKGYKADASDAHRLRLYLRRKRRAEVPIIVWDNALWARVSAQLYNSEADYEALAQAVLELAVNAPASTQPSHKRAPAPISTESGSSAKGATDKVQAASGAGNEDISDEEDETTEQTTPSSAAISPTGAQYDDDQEDEVDQDGDDNAQAPFDKSAADGAEQGAGKGLSKSARRRLNRKQKQAQVARDQGGGSDAVQSPRESPSVSVQLYSTDSGVNVDMFAPQRGKERAE